MDNASLCLNKKYFRLWDIAVYALIAALIVVLVFAFQQNSGERFAVYIDGNIVLEYDLESGGYTVFDSERVTALSKTEFAISSAYGKNVLTVDLDKKDAFISDADCASKDCKSMKLSSGGIVCAPHRLTVKYLGGNYEPTVG